MYRRVALLLAASVLLAGCAHDTVSGARRCDDGGSGGVVIDGVCL